MLIISASRPEFTTSSSRSANPKIRSGSVVRSRSTPIYASHSPPATPAGERFNACENLKVDRPMSGSPCGKSEPEAHHRGGPCRCAWAGRHPGLAPQPRRRSSAAPRAIPCWRWIAGLNEIPNLENGESISSCLCAPGFGQTVHPERVAHFSARAVISEMSGPLAAA